MTNPFGSTQQSTLTSPVLNQAVQFTATVMITRGDNNRKLRKSNLRRGWLSWRLPIWMRSLLTRRASEQHSRYQHNRRHEGDDDSQGDKEPET
jgi:hypothetical protein